MEDAKREAVKVIQVDPLLKATVPMFCKEGRKVIGTGTGFFFEQNGDIFLLTNRHIFIDEEKNFYPDKITIKLNKSGGELRSEDLTLELYKPGTDDKLWKDLNGDVDLAALRLGSLEGFIVFSFKKENLPPDNLRLGLGEQVLVIGYPRGFYDDFHNLPITRSASIASAYGLPFKKMPIFLIDGRLHPGTSGSPVITIPKHITQSPEGGVIISGKITWYFLGVNSGEFGDLQLNAIWYSHLIPELIKKFETKMAK